MKPEHKSNCDADEGLFQCSHILQNLRKVIMNHASLPFKVQDFEFIQISERTNIGYIIEREIKFANFSHFF
ncbi:hypothetical protein TcWFU_008862 [Taenia crassiceps]|uniref:Uncharacterized protein n=1 Tax=Taenia crassiceps TaxID=6207 RepID=A0ABR4QM43_9CEST